MVHSFHTINPLNSPFEDKNNLSGKKPSTKTEDTVNAENLHETSAVHGSFEAGRAVSQQTAAEPSRDCYAVNCKNIPQSIETNYLFNRFMRARELTRGLRVQFAPIHDRLFSGNWVTVDLAMLETTAKEAGGVWLDFADDYFDKVLCTDLNRISRPSSLIGELRRVLKRRGQIWAQAPLTEGVNAESYDDSGSYWYFTPEGFQVLFEQFDEIVCSVYQDSLHLKPRESYFYGIKPEIETSDADCPILFPA